MKLWKKGVCRADRDACWLWGACCLLPFLFLLYLWHQHSRFRATSGAVDCILPSNTLTTLCLHFCAEHVVEVDSVCREIPKPFHTLFL